MTEKLLNCPHCGGAARVRKIDMAQNETWYHVDCTQCSSNAIYKQESDAVKSWNTRVFNCSTKCGCIRQSDARKPLVYIASPYGGKPENLIRAQQIMTALQECRREYAYISPIISYGFAYDMFTYNDGIKICTDLLSHCDQLWIINDDGESKGVKIERDWALKHGMPIHEYATQLDAVEGERDA